MTRKQTGQTTRQKTANEIAHALKARFAHAGTHPGARELCRILIHYRLRQLEGDGG